MNTDELLRVIEQGLKDVRAEIFNRRHPDRPARKSMSPEARLDELEWKMSGVESDLSWIKSTMRVLEMNVAKLKTANAESAEPSSATHRPKPRSRR